MRPGLVVIGLAFAVVGAGLLTSFFVFSAAGPEQAASTSVSISLLAPTQTQVWTLTAVSTSSGTLTLAWASTIHANVTLWKAAPCTTTRAMCADGPAVVNWASNLSGHWKGTGSVAASYLLAVTDVGPTNLNFNATLSESYPGPSFGLGTPGLILLTIGSVLLLGTGAIGVFLGLFLRGGVYEPPAAEPEFSDPGLYLYPEKDGGEEPLDETYPGPR